MKVVSRVTSSHQRGFWQDMSVFVKLFGGAEKTRRSRQEQQVEQQVEELREREELLVKRRDSLKDNIHRELLLATKASRKNRGAALQALRRKKGYEKQLKHVDCAVKVVRSASKYVDVVNTVNDLMKDITEKQPATQHISDRLQTPVRLGVDFDEDELLAELERLEKDQDQSLFEKDTTEEGAACLTATRSPPRPANMEEEEEEEEFEYLRRWADQPSCSQQERKGCIK